MVYIAYFTELNSKIWDYAQKQRICRKNCKYALDERFHGHFCPRRKPAKSCHPATAEKSCYDWQCLPRPLRYKGNGHLYIKKSNTVNPISFFQNLTFEWTWAGNLTKRWSPEKRRWPWRALGLNGSPSIPKGGCSILKEGFSMSFFSFFFLPSFLSVQEGREAPRQRRGMWVGFEKEEWKMRQIMPCPISE